MSRILRLCVLVLMMTACAPSPVGNDHVPQPKKPVDITHYMGDWFEIARYENYFEKGCEAVTASYALLPDGKISVINRCREGGVNGEEEAAEGTAKIVENTGNAQLKISFFGPFYLGNYWVLDHADDYSWSIVGEPSGKYLWILARQAKVSEQEYEALVKRAAALGYNVAMLKRVKHS
jgi:apolipoprotein D and lipocalin family protein